MDPRGTPPAPTNSGSWPIWPRVVPNQSIPELNALLLELSPLLLIFPLEVMHPMPEVPEITSILTDTNPETNCFICPLVIKLSDTHISLVACISSMKSGGPSRLSFCHFGVHKLESKLQPIRPASLLITVGLFPLLTSYETLLALELVVLPFICLHLNLETQL